LSDPSVGFLADQPIGWHEHAIEHDLVEVVLAGKPECYFTMRES
jgi:hypothetical protein